MDIKPICKNAGVADADLDACHDFIKNKFETDVSMACVAAYDGTEKAADGKNLGDICYEIFSNEAWNEKELNALANEKMEDPAFANYIGSNGLGGMSLDDYYTDAATSYRDSLTPLTPAFIPAIENDARDKTKAVFDPSVISEKQVLDKIKDMEDACVNLPVGGGVSACVDLLQSNLMNAYNVTRGDKIGLGKIILNILSVPVFPEEPPKAGLPHRDHFVLVDFTGNLGFSQQSRFYAADKRANFDPGKSSCLATDECHDLSPGLDILFKTFSFNEEKQHLHLGSFYNYTSLKTGDKESIAIRRHRAGLLSEIDLGDEQLSVQAGAGVVKFDAQKTSDPSKGLDVGAKNGRLAGSADINPWVGLDLRESLVVRTPLSSKSRNVGLLFAFDFFQDFWRHEDLKYFNWGLGLRFGLSFYLEDQTKAVDK
ncbi:MAG: hypothetical protein Q8P84_05020 [Deltaproteobacteria bacterium]|nr:hypothetical protein [Deltaproteobacteria bacterium]